MKCFIFAPNTLKYQLFIWTKKHHMIIHSFIFILKSKYVTFHACSVSFNKLVNTATTRGDKKNESLKKI